MSSCIDHDVLDAFALGDLGDVAAVRVAAHLDACPSCATYAATADPLAAEFAHDVLNTRSLHPHAGAHRIDTVVV